MTSVRKDRKLIKQGWLKKKSKIIGSWRKRWTVVESYSNERYSNITEVIMSTYKTMVDFNDSNNNTQHLSWLEKKRRNCTECINLLLFPLCQPLSKNTQEFEVKNIAMIAKQQKSYLFRCPSAMERNEWCYEIVSNALHTTLVNERYMKHDLIQGFIHQHCISDQKRNKSTYQILYGSNVILPPLVIHLIQQYFVFVQNQTCKERAIEKCSTADLSIEFSTVKAISMLRTVPPQAIFYFMRVMTDYSFNFRSHSALAKVLQKNDQKSKAIKHLEIAMWLAPYNADIIMSYAHLVLQPDSNAYSFAMDRVLNLLNQIPTDDFNTNFNLALYLYLLRSKFIESEKYFMICMALYPRETVFRYTAMLNAWGEHMLRNCNDWNDNSLQLKINPKSKDIRNLFENYIDLCPKHYFYYFAYCEYLFSKEQNFLAAEMKYIEGLECISFANLDIEDRQTREIISFINGYAMALLHENKYESALKKCEQCVLIQPQLAVHHRNCAQCCSALKYYQQAEEHFVLAMAIEPQHTIEPYTDMLSSLEQNKKAEQLFIDHIAKVSDINDEKEQKMDVNNDDNLEMYLWLYGNWLQTQKRFDDAGEQFQKGFTLWEERKSNTENEDNKKKSEIDKFRNYYGCMLYAMGEYTSALKQIEICISLKPNFHEYYLFAANICAKLLEFIKGQQFLATAMAFDPKNTIAWHVLLLRKTRNASDVECVLKQYVNENPNDFQYYMAYAEWLFEEKRFKEIEHYAHLAINMATEKKDMIMCRRRYGHILENLHKYTKSLDMYAQCLELNSETKSNDIYIDLAVIHRNMGSYSKADEYYQKLFELDPKSCRYYGSYGYLLYLTERWSDAEKYINEAIEHIPTNSAYLYYKGLLLKYHLRDYEKAEIAFKKSLSNCRSFLKYEQHISKCYFEYGLLLFDYLHRKEESVEYFRKAVEIDIHHTEKYIDQYHISIESTSLVY